MTNTKLMTAFAAVLITACASNTGVVPIGDGIYMSSKQDYSMNWHGAKVKAELYQEAIAFCAKQGKQSSPVSDTSRDAVMYSNYASAEVKFRCR
jgi:hypothetical protein